MTFQPKRPFFRILLKTEVWSNGALDPWSGMGVYPEHSKGPQGPMVQEINEDGNNVGWENWRKIYIVLV